MNISAFWAIICAFSISVMPLEDKNTDSDRALVQAYMNERELDLFIKGDFNTDNTDIKVGNKTADIIDFGTISEKNITVRTTFLTDISTSMPQAARGSICGLLEREIKELAPNEEIRIVTFGDTIKTLQDFTSDRYDLSNAVKEIDFSGTQSTIYDALYNTIPNIGAEDGEPCFYRTVVITDGADYAVEGITKEELFMRLRTETYPIDVICVSPEKPENPNKDLSALSRISNGGYAELYPESDIEACASELTVGDYYWIRSKVPVDLLDGSARQVAVSDGNAPLIFDMKVSAVEAPEDIPQSAPSSSAPVSSVIPPISSMPDESGEAPDESVSAPSVTGIVIIAAAGAAVIAAVIVIFVKRKKACPPVETPRTDDEPDINEATEYYDEDAGGERYTIKLSPQNGSAISRTFAVADSILLGRADNCTMRFDDKSVSREQCKIIAGSGGLAVVNLSTSNITKLNGVKVNAEIPLHSGDVIRFGRISLKVELIQRIGDERSDMTASEASDSEYTESIF